MTRTGHLAKELQGRNVDCRHCSMFTLCLPVGVGLANLDILEKVIKHRRLLRRGERLFSQGEAFGSVFAVKSGSLKTYWMVDQRTAHVTGFHMPGEIIGLDAIGAGSYQYSAEALETSSLCEVPVSSLEELGTVVHSVQRQMLRIMSGKLRYDLQLQALHTKKSAEARLAAFLVNFSRRLAKRGLSATDFRLSMSRGDIGNYLGLTKETVSRVLTQFHKRCVISVTHKQVRVEDLSRLECIAGLRDYQVT